MLQAVSLLNLFSLLSEFTLFGTAFGTDLGLFPLAYSA